ncbi:MAG: polysaccharide biosynthesis protein [Kiritimatiellae bacterium]|nr:polysaccharide biosynthesis protein [Kiritimatiellia bacterium]
MITFDIEKFVRKYMTKRPESLLKADFEKYSAEMHARIDGKRMLVIGGAGTIGSNYVKAALRNFRPAAMYVVDIDENSLTELTRELRAGERLNHETHEIHEKGEEDGEGVGGGGFYVPAEYITEPIDLGSRLFEKFFAAHGPFDIVANFAARKHVRAERDVHSIEAMCETNVFMAKKLLDILVKNPPEAFFCVSTDKAANPVNVMGATKKLMEETIMAYSDMLPIKTARFANVAFSNGSLPIGWLNRIAKHQPLSCPLGIRRFFVSPIESGELCLAASVLADSGDIVYPKLDENKDMIPFDAVVKDMLADMGLGCWECKSSDEAKEAMEEYNHEIHERHEKGYPCEFFGSDTSGEKSFEEFYTATDEKDETKFVNLGVVKNSKKRSVEEVEGIFKRLHAVFDNAGSTKAEVVEVLGEYLPNFHHIEKGKGLDSRM